MEVKVEFLNLQAASRINVISLLAKFYFVKSAM